MHTKKRAVFVLFAATASTATMADPVAATQRPTPTPSQPRTTPTQSMERVAIVFAKLRALFGVTEQTVKTPAAAPRRLRNGSPANGNVARRSAPPPEPEQPTTPPPSTTN